MKPARVLLVLLTVSALPVTAAAQPADDALRDRARTFLVVRIADALKLNDQDALKVSAVIRQSDEQRQQLVKDREAMEERLRTALTKSPPDPAELSKLIEEGNQVDQKLALVPEDTFRDLQKILTVEQQAKLLLFRRELQGEVRRAMQRRLGAGRRSGQGRGRPLGDD